MTKGLSGKRKKSRVMSLEESDEDLAQSKINLFIIIYWSIVDYGIDNS